jgi:hypothetical protein
MAQTETNHTHVLETELQTYRDKLPELKEEEGKFVLIKGKEVVGVFRAYEDAVKAGYEAFKLEPFLVKQIRAIEQVQVVTRLLNLPCHT